MTDRAAALLRLADAVTAGKRIKEGHFSPLGEDARLAIPCLTSLDARARLMAERLPDHDAGLAMFHGAAQAKVYRPEDFSRGGWTAGPTPARAWLAAVLRAMAAGEGGG